MELDKREALELLRRGHADDMAEDHSARRQTRWGSRVITATAALALGAAAAGWYFRPRAILVRAVTVVPTTGAAEASPTPLLSASGYVVPFLQATVAAQVTGMITAVYVQAGEHVRAGQILARLDDSAALATVAAAKAQMVADQALIAQYEAQAANDSRNVRRLKKLAKAGLVSAASLDAARTAAATSAAALAHGYDIVDADRKVLRLDQTLLSYTVIRAPFSGVVTDRYAHPGEVISPQAVGGFTQTGICTLVDMKSLELDVDVNETYISRVNRTDPVDIVLDAYPNWHIPGHVIGIVPTANRQKATVEVRIAFNRSDPRVLPQMAAQVRFNRPLVHQATKVYSLEIPDSAVFHARDRSFVWVLAHGRVHRKTVRVAQESNGTARVLDGLQGGEMIVASANGELHDGRRVREQ